jgi:hypothetical protein
MLNNGCKFCGRADINFRNGVLFHPQCSTYKEDMFWDHIRPRLCYSSFMGMSLGVEVFLNVGAGQEINDQIISVLSF